MTKHDDGGRVRLVVPTTEDLMTLGLGEVALAEAIESLHVGGYPRPTDEQFEQLGKLIAAGTLAMPHLVADMATTSAEQLEDSARTLGALIVARVLGPPPWAN